MKSLLVIMMIYGSASPEVSTQIILGSQCSEMAAKIENDFQVRGPSLVVKAVCYEVKP